MARVAPQFVPQNEESIAKPSSKERVVAGKAQSPVSPVAAQRSESKVQSTPVAAASKPILEEAVPSPTPLTEADAIERSSAEREGAALPLTASGKGIATAQFEPEPAVAARQPQRVVGALSSHATAARATQARMGGMADRVQTGLTASVTASIPQLQLEAAPHSSFELGAQLPVGEMGTAREAKTAMLPSGLSAVSTVTARHHTLAIDQAGTLFLSEDSGRHWETIARQWIGRVVVVRVKPALKGPAAAGAVATGEGAKQGGRLTAGAAVAPSPLAAVFEIVNDSDLIWTSTDGKTWKAN
jgi:hypothetical protein